MRSYAASSSASFCLYWALVGAGLGIVITLWDVSVGTGVADSVGAGVTDVVVAGVAASVGAGVASVWSLAFSSSESSKSEAYSSEGGSYSLTNSDGASLSLCVSSLLRYCSDPYSRLMFPYLLSISSNKNSSLELIFFRGPCLRFPELDTEDPRLDY